MTEYNHWSVTVEVWHIKEELRTSSIQKFIDSFLQKTDHNLNDTHKKVGTYIISVSNLFSKCMPVHEAEAYRRACYESKFKEKERDTDVGDLYLIIHPVCGVGIELYLDNTDDIVKIK